MQTLLGPHLCPGSWYFSEVRSKAKVRGAPRGRDASSRGQAKSITDLAEQEGVTDAYVCRLLPLTCLAPDIVEAMLDGLQPKGLRLADVLGNGPLGWEEQRVIWGFGALATSTRRKSRDLKVVGSVSILE
jgi:hypothetical protein